MYLLFTHCELAGYLLGTYGLLTVYLRSTYGLLTVYLPSTDGLLTVCLLSNCVQRMHLLINSLVTMLRLEEEEQSDALAAAYEPFVGFAPAGPEA